MHAFYLLGPLSSAWVWVALKVSHPERCVLCDVPGLSDCVNECFLLAGFSRGFELIFFACCAVYLFIAFFQRFVCRLKCMRFGCCAG